MMLDTAHTDHFARNAVDGGGDTDDIHSQRIAPLYSYQRLHRFGKQ